MFNVMVNGAGNIGTTLTNVLLRYREALGIDDVYLCKNQPKPWLEEDLEIAERNGAIICTSDAGSEYPHLSAIGHNLHFVFECGRDGSSSKNLPMYLSLPNLVGVCAQGSERKFGPQFMAGVNPKTAIGEKFVHVASCNTHGCVAILQTFAGADLANLEKADFVVVRRSEDLSRHERLVGANVIARHTDPVVGTHHATDIIDLFGTVGARPQVVTSDITTPSQLTHSVRFNLALINQVTKSELEDRIDSNEFLAVTEKFDSNLVFEVGRRYGFQGRIYSHAIVVANNMIVNGRNVTGWCFVPQEGCTILSSVQAFLLQRGDKQYEKGWSEVKNGLLRTSR